MRNVLVAMEIKTITAFLATTPIRNFPSTRRALENATKFAQLIITYLTKEKKSAPLAIFPVRLALVLLKPNVYHVK